MHLDPAALGAAVTAAAAAGLVSLFAGGTLADRVGRRPVLVIGLAGTGTALLALALLVLTSLAIAGLATRWPVA